MKASKLQPRKAPAQDRSKAMVELILQAATRVLERESLAGFNTNRVAEVAGISIGSLYQYFPNKAALITMLIARAQTALADQLREVVDKLGDVTLTQALRAIAKLAVRQQYGNPVLAAALDHEEKRLPIQAQLMEAEETLLGALGDFFDRYKAEMARPLPRNAAHDCLVITKALVEADMERGTAPTRDLERRIVRALKGYLTVAV